MSFQGSPRSQESEPCAQAHAVCVFDQSRSRMSQVSSIPMEIEQDDKPRTNINESPATCRGRSAQRISGCPAAFFELVLVFRGFWGPQLCALKPEIWRTEVRITIDLRE